MTNHEKTLRELEKYFKESKHNMWGLRSIGKTGGIAQIMTDERTYFVTCVIDKDAELA